MSDQINVDTGDRLMITKSFVRWKKQQGNFKYFGILSVILLKWNSLAAVKVNYVWDVCIKQHWKCTQLNAKKVN